MIKRPHQRDRLAADLAGQLPEDPLHLLALFERQLAELVAQLDDRRRLHENGGAAGGLVVHEAAELRRGTPT